MGPQIGRELRTRGLLAVIASLIGMLAWFFRNKEPRVLVRWGIVLVTITVMTLAVWVFSIVY